MDSVFRKVSRYGLNATSKFHPRDVILLFANTSTSDMMPAQFPIQWSQKVKREYDENDESPNSTEV